MLSLERYTDLYNRRANGTLDPASLQAFNELEAAGRTAALEPLRQNATPQLGTSQDRPGTGSTVDPTQLQVGQTAAPPPAFGPSAGELSALEAQRNPANIPRSFEAEQLEQQMLQRHATTTSPATVTPVSPPPTTTTAPPPTTTTLPHYPPGEHTPRPAPPTTTTTVPPTTTSTQPAPPSAAAGSLAAPPAAPVAEPTRATTTTPSSPPPYPNVQPPPGVNQADALENYKAIHQQIKEEGRADTGALLADKLGLPAADMPGGQYEGLERAGQITPASAATAATEHPFRLAFDILGAPINETAAAVTAALRPVMEGKTAATLGDVAGFAAGLAIPGVPKTGAFRAAPVVKKLQKVADTTGRATAGAASAEATRRLATKGLKVDPRKVMTQFQNHVEAARAAVSPAEMRDSFKRAVAVVEQQWPGAEFAHVKQIKTLLAQMRKLEKKIGFRKTVTKLGRAAMGVAAAVTPVAMGVQEVRKIRKTVSGGR